MTGRLRRLGFLGSRGSGESGGSAATRRPGEGRTRRTFAVTFVGIVIIAAFLSPMLRSLSIALKSPEQLGVANAPLWPATPETFEYDGRTLDVYQVPIDGTTRELALVRKGQKDSDFVDPANTAAGVVNWVGSWRALDHVWQLDPKWSNFAEVWELIDYPKLLFNTAAIALIGTVGVLFSCILVAYGFARFRFPGRGLLFTILIATIFLPSMVTLIPTYTLFVKLGWWGTWLPLLVPTFFANAYDVFLLRQYFLTIPRDLDEAAAIEGAGPIRILRSVIIPQAWPVIAAVGIFHVVYSWNDFLGPLLYLSAKPELQTVAIALARFEGIHFSDQNHIQAGVLLTLAIPVVLFLIFQRFFVRGIVITGVEK
jgi:multiple sugar transport system permease protein